MNDRYLYRAKRTDNGEWAEGTLLHKSSSFSVECDEYYIFDGIETSSNDDLYLVDPSTICQCTGLKDKNGKLIWENDIVKHFYNKDEPERYDIGVVQWDDVHLRFKRTSKTDEKCVGISFYSVYEVIGSAFDNPELLEVGE